MPPPAAEYGLVGDAVGEAEARRPIVVVGSDEAEAGRAADQGGLVRIQFGGVRR